MSAVFRAPEAQFEPLTLARLPAVLAIERLAYAHPWTEANFRDALGAGYQAQMITAAGELLGYFVAMKGVEEVHLLNITVTPQYQGQGWARLMLDALAIWARGEAALWMWLEVRVGNLRAMQVYEQHGFRRVGQRMAYYPAGLGRREDAIVMSMRL